MPHSTGIVAWFLARHEYFIRLRLIRQFDAYLQFQRDMKTRKLLTIIAFILLLAVSALAQEKCPENLVCFTREEAIEIDKKLTEREGLLKEKETLKAEIEKYKTSINDLLIKLGAKTEAVIRLEQQKAIDDKRLDENLKKRGKCYFCYQKNSQ
jgi:hypothetical protein